MYENQSNNTEEVNSPEIQKFDPQAFLSDATVDTPSPSNLVNDKLVGENIQNTNEGGDGAFKEKEYSFEDDFLESSKETPQAESFNPNDYAEMSKALGIEIKTKEDLESVQSKFKEPASEKETSTSTSTSNYKNLDFENDEFEKVQKYDNVLHTVKTISDEDLMKWNLKNNNPGKYDDNEDELEYQLDVLKESGLFENQIKTLRKNVISELNADKQEIVNTAKERTSTSALNNSRNLETELKNYKDGFNGIQTDPRMLLDAFKSIEDGSLFDEIESNQANVAEMALLWKNRELYYNSMVNPSTNPGTQKFIEHLQNSKTKPVTGKDTLRSPMAFDPNAFMNSESIAVKSSGN